MQRLAVLVERCKMPVGGHICFFQGIEHLFELVKAFPAMEEKTNFIQPLHMKTKPTLRLHIPQPCQADWNQMAPQAGGRYCTQCTKVVYDFSQMTDVELLQFFQNRPADLCGRFHRQQLDRPLHVATPKRSLPIFVKKMAATLVAALSFRNATAQPQQIPAPPTTSQPAEKKNGVLETVILSGRVIKGNNVPVANAKVQVDSMAEVYTDADGQFSLQLTGPQVTTHNLYFSAEELQRTVRTFHPLMGSTEYEVRLMGKEDYEYWSRIAGGISFIMDFPSVRFVSTQQKLSSDTKAILNSISSYLINDTSLKIELKAYGKTPFDIKQAKRKLNLITEYFVKEYLIEVGRIRKTVEEDGPNDTVDILQIVE
jgi:hypothetical protein